MAIARPFEAKSAGGRAMVDFHRFGVPGQLLVVQASWDPTNSGGWLLPHNGDYNQDEAAPALAVPKGGFPDWIQVDPGNSRVILQEGSYMVEGELKGRALSGNAVPNWAITDGSTTYLQFQPGTNGFQQYLTGECVFQTRSGGMDLTSETSIRVYTSTLTGTSVALDYFRLSLEKLA